LAEESGGQPGVHANDTFVFENSLDGMEAGFVFLGCTTSTAKLHSVLYQIQGLHETGGTHSAKIINFINQN
jgi:hypothetical protein